MSCDMSSVVVVCVCVCVCVCVQVTPGLGRLAMKLLGPNTLVQAAIPDIISKVPAEYHQKNRELFHANARHILETLSKAPGLKPVMPKATMYFMVSPPLSAVQCEGFSLQLLCRDFCL